MILKTKDELSLMNDTFDLNEFFNKTASKTRYYSAVGVITDKQIILMDTLNDGHGLHDEIIGNIYCAIYEDVGIKVLSSNDSDNELFYVRENIIKDKDITIRLLNCGEEDIVTYIFIPEYITTGMYELFKKFMNMYNDILLKFSTNYGIFIKNQVIEINKNNLLEVYDLMKNYIVEENDEYMNEVIIGTTLEGRENDGKSR